MIGGMAANQAARVRANVEDLHRPVIGDRPPAAAAEAASRW